MRLVHHYEVPRFGLQDPSPATIAIEAERLGRGDHQAGAIPEVGSIRVAFRRIASEPDVEHLAKTLLPLLDEARWREEKEAPQSAGAQERVEDHASFNGLPEPHVVGYQPPRGPCAQYL